MNDAAWDVCTPDRQRPHVPPKLAYEQDSIELLKVYLAFAEEFEIRPPYYVFLSFLGVRGCEFGVKKAL